MTKLQQAQELIKALRKENYDLFTRNKKQRAIIQRNRIEKAELREQLARVRK